MAKKLAKQSARLWKKYKIGGEENLSTDVFRLPNMSAKQEAVQTKYPEGLYGFIHSLKEGVYSLMK